MVESKARGSALHYHKLKLVLGSSRPCSISGLLTPRECVEAAIDAYSRGAAPLNSVEGYVRQVIGWREFINGVYWLRGPEYKKLNSLGATRPLPGWFYTGETPMNCLHHVLKQNLALGWNHHIQRLMVLGNFFLISGSSPQEALRWYNEMYVDAYDWVMAANVIGMSLYADSGYMAIKPYAATSTSINRMSNYCAGCPFDPKRKTGPEACPFNYLYRRFIDERALCEQSAHANDRQRLAGALRGEQGAGARIRA